MIKLSEIYEAILLAIEALNSNKIRSLLASLGVVIGISIVIIMGWLINNMDRALTDTFNIIGEDMFFVDKYEWSGGGNWEKMRNRKDIKYEQTIELKEKVKSAEVIIPNLNKWGSTMTYNGENYNGISLVGTTFENAKTPAGSIELGRYYNEMEDEYGSNVIVIGNAVVKNVFKGQNPLGQFVKLNGHKLQVIGVVVKRGTVMMSFIDNQCFIPVKTFRKIFGNNFRSISAAVKAGGKANMDKVRDEVQGAMRTIRNNQPGKEDDFSINETKTFEDSVKQIKAVVYSVGIGMTMLSFLVGIIGIMNIMFVSVVERTREIGIRKAVGAKNSTILMQFIIESSILCLIGAILSIILCSLLVYGSVQVILSFNPDLTFLTPILPYELLVIATIVSIFVGILAGLMPAIRAAKLNPVDALRYE
ncbi:MAG: ABC transporter permease [Candidatus Kapabacteria bacterium]|nr:ABC transporter permease [Candidatus Kapabacteria bacterium]